MGRVSAVAVALPSLLLVLLLCITPPGTADQHEMQDASMMDEMTDAALMDGMEETSTPMEVVGNTPVGEEGYTTTVTAAQTATPLPLPLPLEEEAVWPMEGVPVSARVNISVYYETMCPDSRRFIVYQIYPVVLRLGAIINLELHSYGKVVELPDGLVQCQHGPRECAGNLMMTCAKNVTEDVDVFLNFTRCVMDEMSGMDAGEMCANETGVIYADVDDCVNSREGERMQEQEGELQASLRPALTYIPWVTINERFTWEQQVAVEKDLQQVVCDTYVYGPKPPACNATTTATTTTAATTAPTQ